jgi:hypothetical protein
MMAHGGAVEGKHAIKWTMLSCTTFRANAVPLLLHVLAYNLANFLCTLALPGEVAQRSLTRACGEAVWMASNDLPERPDPHYTRNRKQVHPAHRGNVPWNEVGQVLPPKGRPSCGRHTSFSTTPGFWRMRLSFG